MECVSLHYVHTMSGGNFHLKVGGGGGGGQGHVLEYMCHESYKNKLKYRLSMEESFLRGNTPTCCPSEFSSW